MSSSFSSLVVTGTNTETNASLFLTPLDDNAFSTPIKWTTTTTWEDLKNGIGIYQWHLSISGGTWPMFGRRGFWNFGFETSIFICHIKKRCKRKNKHWVDIDGEETPWIDRAYSNEVKTSLKIVFKIVLCMYDTVSLYQRNSFIFSLKSSKTS